MYNEFVIGKTYPQPAVYQIRQYKYQDQIYHTLEYKFDKFDVPNKIYGDIMKNITKIWNQYAITNKTSGAIMVGNSGSGKSLMGYILSNIAIINQLPVILCTEIEFKIETINFLSNLTDCVVFLDEFKKNVSWALESQMLTMLADPKNTRKMFIITENDAHAISSYILNRPERARYYFEFNKISPDVFNDYCNSFNISDSFRKELEAKYTTAVIFSFDHLQTLVSEHLHYPDDSLDTLLNTLNIPVLRKPLYVNVEKVIDVETGEELVFNTGSDPVSFNDFKNRTYSELCVIAWKNDKEKNDNESALFKVFIRYNMLEQNGDSVSYAYNLVNQDKKYRILIKVK